MQADWRWCKKCQGLAFSLNQPSVCPAGGSHDHSQSGNYTLPDNDPSAPGQSEWRWCRKCQGLAFSPNQPSVCPAGGSHDHSGSGNYTLASESEANADGDFDEPYSTIELSGSVGRNGQNNTEDVTLVQRLLNAVPISYGGPQQQLTMDGNCNDKTVGAIQGFQLKHFGWQLADGRVDQFGLTWQMLTNIISQIAPVLLQVRSRTSRRTLNVWLKKRSGKPGFDYKVMNIITYDLFDIFLRVLPQTTQFEPSPSISWFPTAAQVSQQDLLVYFVDRPKDGLVLDPRNDLGAGGYTAFRDDNTLVIQVYCFEETQGTLRPGYCLATLSFHEMMHARTDVGPTPPGTDPATGKQITDLHDPNYGPGIHRYPTDCSAQLSDWDRDVMAYNLHRGVRLYTGGL